MQVPYTMSTIGKTICCLAWSVVPALVLPGCSDNNRSGNSVTTAKSAPEESFEQIVETIKRRIQDTPGMLLMREPDGGHSRMVASNTVTSELIPPAKEGDPWRGQVMITSVSRYSLQRSAEELEKSSKKRDAEQNGQNSGTGLLDRPGADGAGVDILEPGLVAPSSNGKKGPDAASDTGPLRRTDTETRTFELEYRDGRWQLLSKTDPKFERAIELAFQEALSGQF